MLPIPDNVRQVLVTLIPASLISEVSCFAFYDNHPCDDKNIDVIICTVRGEIKEYYRRELVCSTRLEDRLKASEIKLYRNTKGDLFYIISAGDRLFIFSRKDTIELVNEVENVESYEIDDSQCTGHANLKIVLTDDAVRLHFDENFVTLSSDIPERPSNDEHLPVIMDIMTKLNEVKYCTKANEVAYGKVANIRQIAAYDLYQDNAVRCDSSWFGDQKLEISDKAVLNIKNLKPLVMVYNGHIVIVFEGINKSEKPVKDVHILLQTETRPSMVYTTRTFKKTLESPFWTPNLPTIPPNVKIAIVAIISLKELNYTVTSGIEFSGALIYKSKNKECMVPFQKVKLSLLDIMKEDTVLSNITDDIHNKLLAIFASSFQIHLSLKHIQQMDTDVTIDLINAFVKYLAMERIPGTNNVVICRGSPSNILNGVTIFLNAGKTDGDSWTASVYARNASQVLSLIHCIHDAIPHRIVITTTNRRPELHSETGHDEEILVMENPMYNGESILKQADIILGYLDKCMVSMNNQGDSVVLSKIGKEIDMFACGEEEYLRFRREVLDEGFVAVSSVLPGAGDTEDGM